MGDNFVEIVGPDDWCADARGLRMADDVAGLAEESPRGDWRLWGALACLLSAVVTVSALFYVLAPMVSR